MKNHPSARESAAESESIELCPQEIPMTAPESRFQFNPDEKQFVATARAVQSFGARVIDECLKLLREKAVEQDGLDYLQVFLIGPERRKLWIIEDGQVIT